MLLLHVSVKCGIGKICFIAVLALEVSPRVVVFGSPLSALLRGIGIVVITVVFRVSLTLALIVILIVFHPFFLKC